MSDRVIEKVAMNATLAKGRWRRLVDKTITDPVGALALALLLVIALVAVGAPWLAPFDPLNNDLTNSLAAPSSANWLGTDELGRDVLSRLMHGTRISLLSSLLATSVAVVVGLPLGLLAGFRGGRMDALVTRLSDMVQSLPGLVLILAVLAVFGPGVVPAMVTLGVLLMPTIYRVVRASTVDVRSELFVDAAATLGLPSRTIIRRHVLPHVLPTLIVQTSLTLGLALLVEAGLSFIGLGVQPPTPSWGAMLSRATTYMGHASHLVFPPGLAIAITALALNLFGDVVRDNIGSGIRHTSSRIDRGRRKRSPSRDDGLTRTKSLRSGDTLVDVTGLTIAFPDDDGQMVPAVSDISFSIARGETVGLVGESGCGKSVTARSIIGLLPGAGQITHGSILVDGHNVATAPERKLRGIRGNKMALVFQDPMASLDPSFTVGHQIAEGLIRNKGLGRKSARSTAIELLEQVGIVDPTRRVDAYPHELSGGMAQRAMIAAALAGDPGLLIADEPTTALDVTVQAGILDLLRSIQRERGMSMLFITHDLGVVADICDRVLVMYAGQVVEAAPVQDIFDQPTHPYTQALLESLMRNQPRERRAATIPGTVPPPGQWPAGCRFRSRCRFAVDACEAAPIPLEAHGSALTRCLRADELAAPRERSI